MTFDSNKRLAITPRIFDTGISTYAAPLGIGGGGGGAAEPAAGPELKLSRSLLVMEPKAPLPFPTNGKNPENFSQAKEI